MSMTHIVVDIIGFGLLTLLSIGMLWYAFDQSSYGRHEEVAIPTIAALICLVVVVLRVLAAFGMQITFGV